MILEQFAGRSADDVWQQAATVFRDSASAEGVDSRGGVTRELLHACFVIEDPRQRWVLSRQPAMNPAFALAEVVWILTGRRDSSFLNFWNPKLPERAGHGRSYDGAYGHRLRHDYGIDQLDRAYNAIRNNPSTRQIALQIWDPRLDLPDEHGQPASCDIPCNICSLLKVRDGKLHWTQVIRSNDMFLGVPHNFVQFTSLQEVFAGWLGLDLGPYVQWSDSLHVYDKDIKAIEISKDVHIIPNEDVLCLTKTTSENAFSVLALHMEEMINPRITSADIVRLIETPGLPQPYENMLMIVAADAARRKRSLSIANELAERCTNGLYRELWRNWMSRNHGKKKQ